MRVRTTGAYAAGVAAMVVAGVLGAGVANADTGQAGAAAKAAADRPVGVAPDADFDGDGHADAALSAPSATVDGAANAGYVGIAYGSADGTDTAHHQVIDRTSAGVPGNAKAGERFGKRTVARDLDGDGYTDLVVHGSQGAVLLWGSADGLGDPTALPDSVQSSGDLVTAGDFDGDGNVDLVAAASGNSTQQLRVLYGPFKRTAEPARTGEIETEAPAYEPADATAGDLDGDGSDDLVVTTDFEEMSHETHVFSGSADGLAGDPKLLDDAASATVGDVDGDGYGDLVLRTVPGDSVENLPYDHGTLKVVYGSAEGPSERTTTIDQDTAGVPGANEDGDQFGYSLDTGDVDGDGKADVAVGVPYESNGTKKETGSTVLLRGGEDGLSGSGAQAFHQGTPGVPGALEAGDQFGAAVSLQDTDGEGHSDLIAGSPGEDGASLSDTGAAWTLRGGSDGITTEGAVSFGPGELGAPESGAGMGSVISR